MRLIFSSLLIFLSVLTVFFAIFFALAAHRFSACNDVLRLSLSKKKNAKPQAEEIIKYSHLSLYTMDPSFGFTVFILYQTPVPELVQLFVILADAG